ncbi:ABC transporter ATP-binding/permease protein YojI [Myxococcaceae bacterium]|nr:ABC transporter ATP-binding/permease protein YojI [Myxococcaceae bacterium]
MIRFLLRSSRWILSLSILAGLAAGLGGVGLIAIINHALEQAPAAGLAWVFAALCALLLVARGASSVLLMRLGQDIIFDLRIELSRMVLSAPLARLQALGPGRILASLTQDIATLAEAFQWLPMLCVNAAIVGGCLFYLGWLSSLLLALVAVTMFLGIGTFKLFENRAMRALQTAREYDDALHGHLRSLTQGVKELKLHRARRDAFLTECLQTTATHYRRHYVSGMATYLMATNWGNGLFYAVIGILLFALPALQETAGTVAGQLGLPLDAMGGQAITPQVLRGYCLAILYMMSPLTILVEGVPVLMRASIALKKIQALGREAGAADAPAPLPPRGFQKPPALEFMGVTHRYYSDGDERCFTLGPLDLAVQPGELVFLIGGNGSGKTTLALLLVGLYAPERGAISLGGRPVTERGREEYRQQFSAVFSDFYLFDSLLGFQKRELDEETRAYLAHLRLDHKVRIEDGALSTVSLSQGQRKRLALLVAYLEDRPFYVFDEWAADQDPVFKKIFYTEILASLKARGKTVVVITHDDAYFHVADRCLKLDEGRLTEIPVAGRNRETAPGNSTGEEWQNTTVEISS